MTWREQFDVASLAGEIEDNVEMGSTLEVESDDSGELFYSAWSRSWLKEVGQTFEKSIGYVPSEHDPESARKFWWRVATDSGSMYFTSEPDATVGDFAAFTKDSPTRLKLAWGVGGDLPAIFAGIKEIVNVGLTLAGLAALFVDGQQALDRRIYARQRRLFEDWRDGGGISADLRRAVLAEQHWDMQAFIRIFGCSTDAASRLLSQLEYEPRRDDSARRTWHDPSD